MEIYEGKGKPCSVEKANIFMVGINIYELLAKNMNHFRKKPSYHIRELNDDDFKDISVFQNEKGHLLKELILDSTKSNPEERISYQQFLHGLNEIYPYTIENHYREHINFLKECNPFNPIYTRLESQFYRMLEKKPCNDGFVSLQYSLKEATDVFLHQEC